MHTETQDTLGIIRKWAMDLPSSDRTTSHNDCFIAIARAIKKLGYGYPFDREQRKLNELLLDSLAGEAACLTAWNFYHEAQIIKAAASHGAAYSRTAVAA